MQSGAREQPALCVCGAQSTRRAADVARRPATAPLHRVRRQCVCARRHAEPTDAARAAAGRQSEPRGQHTARTRHARHAGRGGAAVCGAPRARYAHGAAVCAWSRCVGAAAAARAARRSRLRCCRALSPPPAARPPALHPPSPRRASHHTRRRATATRRTAANSLRRPLVRLYQKYTTISPHLSSPFIISSYQSLFLYFISIQINIFSFSKSQTKLLNLQQKDR